MILFRRKILSPDFTLFYIYIYIYIHTHTHIYIYLYYLFGEIIFIRVIAKM